MTWPNRILLFLVIILSGWSAKAQEPDSSAERINLQSYTPSVLMRKGQWELKLFNNLYTQTRSFDARGRRVDNSARDTYNTLLVQTLFGFKPRISIGIDAWVKSVHTGPVESSPLDVFSNTDPGQGRTALSGIGPKVKITPLPKVPKLALQSTFLFPVAADQEGVSNGRPYLSMDSYLWITQIFYDLRITDRVQVFAQVAPWASFRTEPFPDGSSRFSLSTPATVFLSWFPTPRLSLSVQEEYWPTWGEQGIDAWFRQEGLSAKFQVLPGRLELEASATIFSNGRNTGAGSTYNFGLRFLR